MSMQLLPSRTGLYEYIFIDLLIKNINKHAKNQDYAMTRKRSKQLKKDVLMKIWIRCNRDDKKNAKNYDHRIIFSKHVDCSFECIAKLQFNLKNENDLNDWILIIEHADHNHLSTKSSVFIIQRNIAMQNFVVLHEIQKKFWKNSKINSVLKELCMNENNLNFIFK